jgi:hypothetical protein
MAVLRLEADRSLQPPIAEDGCPATPSWGLTAKQVFDVRAAHLVEIVRHRDLPRQEAKAAALSCVGVSSAVTLTRGLPALAITNASPRAAFSMNRDRCVLASWMLTICFAPLLNLVHLT